MLSRVSEKFYGWAKGGLVIALLVLTGFFGSFLMPLIGGLMQGGQGDIQPLDTMLFVPPDELFNMIEKYGEYGRVFYRNAELTADIAYPIAYLFFFALAISWLFQRGFAPENPLRKFNVVPLGAWFFDLLENLAIVFLLSVFPSTPTAVAWLLFAFIALKWMFALACIVLVLIGLAAALKNGFRKRA